MITFSPRPTIFALLMLGACTVRDGRSDISGAARTDTGHASLAATAARAESSQWAVTKGLPQHPIAPSLSDLEILKRELVTPLASVPLTALHDSFDEPRDSTRRHDALDILAPRGTIVRSAAAGRLLKMINSRLGGLMVYAADSTGHFILMYAHLDGYQPGLVEGQHLFRGQPLGIVGTTGNAPPDIPHLHFAVERSSDLTKWWKGEPVNPYPLLKP